MCDWFVDNKLSVPFGQDKTKSILFGTKHKLRNAKALNIVYNGTGIKQYEKGKYLECILDQSLSGETMALNVIDKVNSSLKFLHRQNRFLTPPLRRLSCNALIQPLFDYACRCVIKGGGLPCPFSKLKEKCSDFGKKIP